MQGLMHVCENWGDAGCHPDISKLRNAKEIMDGEDIPIWPVGEELKRLDDICKDCESRLFIVEEQQCPYCDSKDVESTGISGDSPGYPALHEFKCNDCGGGFWINEMDLK